MIGRIRQQRQIPHPRLNRWINKITNRIEVIDFGIRFSEVSSFGFGARKESLEDDDSKIVT